MSQQIRTDDIEANIRECYLLASNKRMSSTRLVGLFRDQPTIHALCVETVKVPEERRRQGVFKRFIEALCRDTRFELVVVEGVQNPILAEALIRWGWDFDAATMDFYHKTN